jgi:hypothetical protein
MPGFGNKSPTLRILDLLKDAKVPMPYFLIRKHISERYSDNQLIKALDRLVRKKYIGRTGKHKNNLYYISSPGLDYLYFEEKKNIARDISNLIFSYLIRIGTGVD